MKDKENIKDVVETFQNAKKNSVEERINHLENKIDVNSVASQSKEVQNLRNQVEQLSDLVLKLAKERQTQESGFSNERL